MSDITYDKIAANVASATTDGSRVDISWKCAASGKDMGKTSAHMSYDNSASGRVGTNVKQGVIREIGMAISNFISKLFGGSAAGRIASNAARTEASHVQSNATSAANYNENTKRAAIVESFKSIQDKFTWDEAGKRYVAKA